MNDFRITVPASTSNLGPGFDILGAALSLYSRFDFERSDELIVTGCPEEFRNSDNLVVRAYKYALDKLGLPYAPFKLDIKADVPVSRGLGSSSTCVVAGAFAAYLFNDLRIDRNRIVNICTDLEGHPDNVAPTVIGGMVSGFREAGKIRTISYTVDPKWHFITIVPDYEVLTNEARKIIKRDIDLDTAVYTAGHAVAMIRAMETADESLMADACHDLLHEPYRKQLIRDYEPLKDIALDNGACAYYISGSGSTMIAMTTDKDTALRVRRTIEKARPSFSVMDLGICGSGVHVEY